jgi:transcriptional regulator with XRE-family HTH domain
MKANDVDYDWWQPDHRYALPPRSIFVNLQPIDINGPYVENLSSFFLRLSHLHRLSPRKIAQRFIISRCETFRATACDIPAFNGACNGAQVWTKHLEVLTGTKNLDRLSFCGLESFITQSGLMARNKKWCPICHDESISAGTELYDRLLWAVASVQACPKHGIRLVEQCICNPKEKLMGMIIAQRTPGVCFKCGRLLSSDASNYIEKADDLEIQRAQLVADFIVERKLVEGLSDPSKIAITKFLKYIIDNYTNGIASKTGKRLGVSKSMMSEWLKGNHTPRFPQILNIAQACGCSICDVYLGNINEVKEFYIPPDSDKFKTVRRPKKMAYKAVTENRLKAFVTEENPKSLSQVAAEIDVCTRFLTGNFSIISRQIVENYRASRRRQAEIKIEKLRALFREKATNILKSGKLPTAYLIKKELKTLAIHEKKICSDVCHEVIMSASMSN